VNAPVGRSGGSGSARRLGAGWRGMECEVLPVDDGWAQRLRRVWTCDHYSEVGGQFLGRSFGHDARHVRYVLNPNDDTRGGAGTRFLSGRMQ
jgi:hypothetical protein